MTNLETARKSWISIDKIFGGDGSKFELADFTVEAYEDLRTKYGWEKVKQALKAAFEANDKRMPTVNELSAALKGYPSDAHKRATEDAEGIWGAVSRIGGYGHEQAERALNRYQWKVVQSHGGWPALCEMLTNDMKATWIAQTRDHLMSLYVSVDAKEEQRKQRLALEAKANPQLLASKTAVETTKSKEVCREAMDIAMGYKDPYKKDPNKQGPADPKILKAFLEEMRAGFPNDKKKEV
jgi:hypothetical protein